MDDLISRQAAINSIGEMSPAFFSAYQHNTYVDKQEVMIRLKALPSVQPEQKRGKRGKWVNRYRAKWDRTLYWFRACSECDFERDDCNPEKDTAYCPNCGAKMEETENDKRRSK